MASELEGVIKYQLVFSQQDMDIDDGDLDLLNACRARLLEKGLLGSDPARYEGLGFGNISLRKRHGSSQFYISATQTGHLERLSRTDLACVTGLDVARNTLFAKGINEPSSEAMTHGVLYQTLSEVDAVVHVHSPVIWHHSVDLHLPETSETIRYGTPEMASAVEGLSRECYCSAEPLVFVMKGHEDGVVVAGKSLMACTEAIIAIQNNASCL